MSEKPNSSYLVQLYTGMYLVKVLKLVLTDTWFFVEYFRNIASEPTHNVSVLVFVLLYCTLYLEAKVNCTLDKIDKNAM